MLKNKGFFVIFSILTLLFVLPLVHGETLDYARYQNLDISLTISGSAKTTSLTDLTANLSLVPVEGTFQKVQSIEGFSKPSAKISKGDSLFYSWDKVDDVTFGYTAKIKTNAELFEVQEIKFPADINDYSEFKLPTKNIDSNNEAIIRQANEIAAGKTSLYSVVFALGEFVNSNVTYNLDYIGSTIKASKVLEIKEGVCDEYSVLFIALCRSLGIPAKYVSGTAFSNIKDNFGPHAWAEVYFPGYGWIPFDPTYGQLGIIDATHIALSKGAEADSSVVYSYIADELSADDLEINANVENKGELLQGKVNMELRALKNKLREGSYVPLEVKVKNLQNYTLPLGVYLVKTPEIIGKNEKHVLLAPLQEKKVYFILKLPTENISAGYIYTALVQASSFFNDLGEENLTFGKSSKYEAVSLEEAQSIINLLSTEESSLNYGASLSCKSSENRYQGDSAIAQCIAKNDGNVMLEDIELCLGPECKKIESLTINNQQNISFNLDNKEEFVFVLSNPFVIKKEYLSINFVERPNLSIISIAPEAIDYNTNEVSILLRTESSCKNLTINLKHLEVSADEIDDAQTISFPLRGKNFLNGKAEIKATCFDLNGQIVEDNKTFKVIVENVPFFMKPIQLFFRIFNLF